MVAMEIGIKSARTREIRESPIGVWHLEVKTSGKGFLHKHSVKGMG